MKKCTILYNFGRFCGLCGVWFTRELKVGREEILEVLPKCLSNPAHSASNKMLHHGGARHWPAGGMVANLQ